MTSRRAITALAASLFALSAPPLLRAQMTVSGRVFAGDRPVQGASIGIPELGIETRTIADGSYNLLIRAAQVRGQTVTITARHRQFGAASAQLQVVGGSVEQNFLLSRDEPRRPPPVDTARRLPPVDTLRLPPVRPGDTTRVTPPTDTTRVPPQPSQLPRTQPEPAIPSSPDARLAQLLARPRYAIDSSAIAETAGPLDLTSALAGRIPGLQVTSASTPGGSSFSLFRGPRSISGPIQPLVVVDGIPVDNSGFTTAAQQFGLGGFDYGTPLQDVALDDVASVSLLDGASAALLYGSRAANGVIVVATKEGGSTPGFSLSHSFRFSRESAIRLPSFQNKYGQGSGGLFEFFNGRGGGINDDVEESWGPILEGQPVIQHSLTEAGRPDVRAWAPHPSGVRDYFGGARTIDANVALQGAHNSSSLRAALGVRSAHGLTPNTTTLRYGATLSGSAQPTSRLKARGSLRLIRASADDRAGTGFDESNPVAGFTRMGRQVDLAALRARIRDTVDQINWINTARNNPFVQSLENSNDDHRGHIIGSAWLTYELANWLVASLRGGTDNLHESRNFQVVRGWRGGYPTALGRATFSGDGTQQQKNSAAERLANLALTATTRRARDITLVGSLGVEARRSTYQTSGAISDSTAGVGRVQSSSVDTGQTSVRSVYAIGTLDRGGYLFVNAGARIENASGLDSLKGSAVFPSASVAYDIARQASALRGMGLGSAVLRAGWWRAGNEITSRTLARTYAGGGPASNPVLGAPANQISGPERTTALELGARLASAGGGVGLDFTVYRETSSELLTASPGATSGTVVSQQGEVTNNGVELGLSGFPYRNDAMSWDLSVSYARNRNTVKNLGGAAEVALSPTLWGAALAARTDAPLGVIVGNRYLRDAATQQLILKNGLPIPDRSGPVVLGSWQPDWTASVQSSLRHGSLRLDVLLDLRMGGRIFSATNYWGSYAGTLASTLVGRDTGLVLAGIDSVSGAPNATNVRAEDYFHALGAIHEAFVYDASYAKLRDVRLSYEMALRFLPGYREQLARISFRGRNLFTWAKAPNIDPETALSVGNFQGFEMGQLPTTRSFGLQLTITP